MRRLPAIFSCTLALACLSPAAADTASAGFDGQPIADQQAPDYESFWFHVPADPNLRQEPERHDFEKYIERYCQQKGQLRLLKPVTVLPFDRFCPEKFRENRYPDWDTPPWRVPPGEFWNHPGGERQAEPFRR